MSVTGDFAAVIKIVQHSKLQRQLVQVGRDIGAVHGQRRIAIAYFLAVEFQVAENLIVGAVFLEDVDHMTNRIRARPKRDLAGIERNRLLS